MTEAGILYPGKFVRVLLLAVPPDWTGVRHDTMNTCTVDGTEEALV